MLQLFLEVILQANRENSLLTPSHRGISKIKLSSFERFYQSFWFTLSVVYTCLCYGCACALQLQLGSCSVRGCKGTQGKKMVFHGLRGQ